MDLLESPSDTTPGPGEYVRAVMARPSAEPIPAKGISPLLQRRMEKTT